MRPTAKPRATRKALIVRDDRESFVNSQAL